MPIRYMGSKRHIAHRVRHLAERVNSTGHIVDLFTGMGCVAEAMAGFRPIVTNDSLTFTATFARARFMGGGRSMEPAEAIASVREPFRTHQDTLVRRNRDRLQEEIRALEGDRTSLAEYMRSAEHVANSESRALEADAASRRTDEARYCMISLYFSTGYFGLRQAIQLDALRYAIDGLALSSSDRDWLLAAWLGSAATVANSPGHTAQYLKPNTETAYKRICRYWRRSVWEEFQNRLVDLKQVGTREWRESNRSEVADALDFVRSDRMEGVGLVYADPPYTKDQYSRYYHVYETMLKYDFPSAAGEGRTPPEATRFSSGFSTKTRVVSSFDALLEAVAAQSIPLILSYPTSGLLSDAGASVIELALSKFAHVETETLGTEHSTLGASQGSKTKTATENLYVCHPA